MISKESATLLLQVLMQVKIPVSDDDFLQKANSLAKAKAELIAMLNNVLEGKE